MQNTKNTKNYLGLDIGTNSVGWALVDEDYNIIKKKGKHLWGVRLFDEASSCQERRLSRGSRRRYQRRRERVLLLQTLFAEEINKVDPNFFLKMNISKLYKEDKNEVLPNSYELFDASFKPFFRNHKTIYHIKKYLMECDEKADIRLIYLALHHSIKYRGNFLHEGEKFEALSVEEFHRLIMELPKKLETINIKEHCFDKYSDLAETTKLIAEIKNLYKSTGSISKRGEGLKNILNPEKDTYDKIIKLIAGSKVKLQSIDPSYSGEESSIEITNEAFEEEITKFDNTEVTELLKLVKSIYDYIALGTILGESKYLSDAMVEKYETHHKQLKELKHYIKTNMGKKAYDDMFNNLNLNNYAAYVGSSKRANSPKDVKMGKSEAAARDKKDSFYKYLKSVLGIEKNQKVFPNPYIEKVAKLIEEGTFLDLINNVNNSTIPYQINEVEIKKIIDNQKKYYPFFEETDKKYGLTTSEKILSIIRFRIPFYVGPLNSKSTWSWCSKLVEGEKVYPWNIDKVIDLETTSETFIKRMLNRCSYLTNSYCLPKDSLTYQLFNVYNEINKIRINGLEISYDDKMAIIEKFKHQKASKACINQYFRSKYPNENIIISSANSKESTIQSDLSSYRKFSDLLGEEFVKTNYEMIEQIIQDVAIFTEPKVLENRLVKKYKLTSNQAKTISKYNFKGFGRLSNKLLTELKVNYETNLGEVIEANIMYLLEHSNDNFMEILYKYDFKSLIEIENGDSCKESNAEEWIKSQYLNPIAKRSLIQAYRIIEDVRKILKDTPIDKYFIECTRHNEKPEVKSSRKELLESLYKEAIKISKDSEEKSRLLELQGELSSYSNETLRSKKLFLYFTQLGRCMYSGKIINNPNDCEIDHIIPQSLIKDDSLDNTVLVYKLKNQEKSDTYPIPKSILFENHAEFYELLSKHKLISSSKKDRLLRVKELTDDELERFVNRQLVSTNQAVKALTELLRNYENVDEQNVIFSKAENVSRFRHKFDILKCREVNDYHHAHDAYLNVVVGNVYRKYFGRVATIEMIKSKRENHKSLNVEKLFENNHNGYWNKQIHIPKIKNYIENTVDCFFTTRTYEGKTLMTKVGIVPANKSKGEDGLFPLKSSSKDITSKYMGDTSKYGGYNNLANGFYCLAKSKDKKGKYFYSIEAINTIYLKPHSSKEQIKNYLIKAKGLDTPEVVIPLLYINQKYKIENRIFAITGKTGDSFLYKNLSQTAFNFKEIEIFKKIIKLQQLLPSNINFTSDEEKLEKVFKIVNDQIVISPAKDDNSKAIILTNNELDLILNIIGEKLKMKHLSYNPMIKIGNAISNGEIGKVYSSLSMYKKCYVILELLKLIKCNRELSDLIFIGESKNFGILILGKKLTNTLYVINESPTGFFKKVYKIDPNEL